MEEEKRLTTSGIEIPVVADQDSRKGSMPGHPGEYPYARGIYNNMYRGRLWTMRQYAGFGTAEETNQRFRYLLENGQTGLSVAFDLATQIGYDSDSPMALGEVGRTGVAIDSLADMETLFNKIPLGQVSTSMTINATAVVLLAMYITVARKQGVPQNKISGTIQNDILKEFIARGTYIYPPEPSMRLITDIFSYSKDNLPKFNTISISGYHIREAGASAAQEVAFTLSNARAYVEAALKAGMEVDSFAPRLSFFFAAHNNLFEEVAKFRAARRIWAKLMKEQYKAGDEKSLLLRFHTQTGGSTLTAQQPENNIVRTAMQALAAVLGGTQSLHTNSFDEALGLPTQRSAEIALRTQQVIGYESGVVDSADPLGGSYLIEYLTDEIEQKVLEIMKDIEKMGGSVKGVETGYFKHEIAKSAYRFQKMIEKDEMIVVGVNKFKDKAQPMEEILKVDPHLEEEQVKRLKELRKNRDNEKVGKCLKVLDEVARSNENIVPPVIDAVEQYTTLGEISNCLRDIWGEYHEVL
ncbi:MAG: methylmalonyl-CoA mutase [candidate division Zixibacteria bacterium HGW-Zixibacteria-1]|nr:MAG: methylmalonyl-CoA mutase [candidate division Zixibacteria bacterium HGW-Zixibacteria-1]